MKKILTVVLIYLFVSSYGQNKDLPTLSDQEEEAFQQALKSDTLFSWWINQYADVNTVYQNYKANVILADSIWEGDQKRLEKVNDFGYTEKLEFVPLIEDLYGDSIFKKGYGVSYLIKTDHSTILFDMGWDDDSIRMAVRDNLELLGVDISEIDAIVISHNHGDHQSEWRWINDKTFVNAQNKNILSDINVYVPEKDLNLDAKTKYFSDPVKISQGVYTTGIIKAPLFMFSTQEQGLIINVKDKGLVIVTGCGHQTIEKLIARCNVLSGNDIYGIFGGVHYPIKDDDFYDHMGYFITGKLPWDPFTEDDLKEKLDFIKSQNIKIIGVSTHDSSPKAINAFNNTFVNESVDLKVGEWIVIK